MKRLQLSCALLLGLLAVTLYNGHHIRQLTNEMIYLLSSAQEMSRQNQWDTALQMTQSAYASWEEHHTYLHVVMNHSDTDQILQSFEAVLQYLKIKESDQYLAANVDLITQLTLLAEMEQPSLVNVL